MELICVDSVVLSLFIFIVFFVGGCYPAFRFTSSNAEKFILMMSVWGLLCLFMFWWLIGNLSSVCKV